MQAEQSVFNHWNPHKHGRRESSPQRCLCLPHVFCAMLPLHTCIQHTYSHTHKFIVVVEVVINITKIVRIKLPFSCAYFISQGIGTKWLLASLFESEACQWLTFLKVNFRRQWGSCRPGNLLNKPPCSFVRGEEWKNCALVLVVKRFVKGSWFTNMIGIWYGTDETAFGFSKYCT